MRTVTEKINVKHADDKLPQQEVEITYELPTNLQEAATDAGSEDNLLEAYNDAKANRAKQAGRNVYRNAAEGSVVSEILAKVVAAVRDFSFANSQRGMGVKTKAAKVDSLLAALEDGKTFTTDELLQMLKSRG